MAGGREATGGDALRGSRVTRLGVRALVATLMMLGGGLVVSVAPASANGQGVWLCGQDSPWVGNSASTDADASGGGATVWNGQHKVTSCGFIYDCGPHQT
ncbi:MAG: hypothetical protein U0Q22_16100 [Acidimicrobiales bacterium]